LIHCSRHSCDRLFVHVLLPLRHLLYAAVEILPFSIRSVKKVCSIKSVLTGARTDPKGCRASRHRYTGLWQSQLLSILSD
jgi:hypothetical protein